MPLGRNVIRTASALSVHSHALYQQPEDPPPLPSRKPHPRWIEGAERRCKFLHAEVPSPRVKLPLHLAKPVFCAPKTLLKLGEAGGDAVPRDLGNRDV